MKLKDGSILIIASMLLMILACVFIPVTTHITGEYSDVQYAKTLNGYINGTPIYTASAVNSTNNHKISINKGVSYIPVWEKE